MSTKSESEKYATLRVSPRRRRETHDLVIAILMHARKGQRKTSIMTNVGLSYSQLKRFLDCLKESSFISEDSGVWKTTKKGANVIEACELCKTIAHRLH